MSLLPITLKFLFLQQTELLFFEDIAVDVETFFNFEVASELFDLLSSYLVYFDL
jgi:hypothetical protein